MGSQKHVEVGGGVGKGSHPASNQRPTWFPLKKKQSFPEFNQVVLSTFSLVSFLEPCFDHTRIGQYLSYFIKKKKNTIYSLKYGVQRALKLSNRDTSMVNTVIIFAIFKKCSHLFFLFWCMFVYHLLFGLLYEFF